MGKEIGNFLRSYEFMGLTKLVNESQAQIYKQSNETYGKMCGKAAKNAGFSGLSFAALGADMALMPCISAIRSLGFFNPLPPQPPAFPTPHNNAEFMDVSIDRALWDWKPELKNEMNEGISDGLSDKWNVYQVVGEWCLANSFDHPTFYKPTFLTVSEPLENGESFRSVGTAFSRLKQKDKTAIFDAVYHQTDIAKSISANGKKVYQDLRALASKLTQGNEAFLTAFKETMNKRAAAEPAPVTAPLAARTTPAPQSAANVPTPASLYPTIAPASRYAPYVPTFGR